MRCTAQPKYGLYYNQGFLNGPKKLLLKQELESFHPIWEERFSLSNPPPQGDTWRSLLRPVYWLGNWQFACLNYFHPPLGVHYRCVKAESFPPFMHLMVKQIEEITKKMAKSATPPGWQLNTCLINYYGSQIDSNGKKTCTARVGEHRDFEPGPVASISLGESAYFQFVKGKPNDAHNIVSNHWLHDGSLLIFWSKLYKEQLFHRIQRVEKKGQFSFTDHLTNYETRRINLTFRFVPEKYIFPLNSFPKEKVEDILPYLKELARYSTYWKDNLCLVL